MSLAIVASDIHDSWEWPDDLMLQNWTTWAVGKHFWLSINSWLLSCELLCIDHIIQGTHLSLIVAFLLWYSYVMCNGRLLCAILRQVLFSPQVPVSVCSHCLCEVRCCSHKAGGGRHQGCPALPYPECWLYLHLGHLSLWWVIVKKTRESTFFFSFSDPYSQRLEQSAELGDWEEGRGFLHLLCNILCLTKLFTIH